MRAQPDLPDAVEIVYTHNIINSKRLGIREFTWSANACTFLNDGRHRIIEKKISVEN